MISQLVPLLAAVDPQDEILPKVLFQVGGLDVTNQMMMVVLAAVLMLLIFPKVFARAHIEAPSGPKNFLESIMEFLRVEVFRPALKEHTDRFVPFLWTLFFFILFCNLLGQIPIGEFGTLFTKREFHWWGTATGTPIVTGGLAVCAFAFIHLNGIGQIARSLIDGTYGHHGHHEEHSAHGGHGHEAAHDLDHVRGEGLAADVPANFQALKDPTGHYADDEHHTHNRADDGTLHGQHVEHGAGMNAVVAVLFAVPLYFWNFAPHPFKPGPEVTGFGRVALSIADVGMWAFLLILELAGALIKPFALMIRLFANMIGGHIVLAALVLMIPVTAGLAAQIGIGAPVVLLSLVIRVLELFVSFLQAYIFTFLVTLFIASAVAPEH